MKKKPLCLVIVRCSMLALLLALPLQAQDDWPADCQLPDLEETMNAANAAQAEGDALAFLNSMSNIADVGHEAYVGCFGEIARSGDELVEAELIGANLTGANLANANLQGADFYHTADPVFAHLQGADLTGANLQGTDLWGANLQGANLQGANLQDADLGYADLQGADLALANLQRANLAHANLQGAKLANADLQGADLSEANLQGASLGGANLQDAILGWALLQGADLERTNLQGADLQRARLLYAGLPNTIFDENSVLPDTEECQWDRQEERLVCDSYWTPDTDMARFSDPAHPEFWDPCVEVEWYIWYCEDSGT